MLKGIALSVDAWVQEFKLKGDNPFIIYKPQGHVTADGCCNLLSDDFLLALQTPLQREIFKSCAENNVVCIDATHKTNGYDFPLITVLVVDEYGEGYPVAWCISNREHKILLLNFFRRLRELCGQINATWLMTDMVDQYYTAWRTVFGPDTKRILCTWHVDRAWRGQLKLIDNRELQAAVYHNLRVLLEETDCDKFEVLLTETVKQLQEGTSTETFAEYFVQHYVANKKEWAVCYRKYAGLNTIMYVESFHRVLKHVYLAGKVNKRMDKCIHTLLLYARDKAFQRLIKLHKGKLTHRLSTITSRHRESCNVSASRITSNPNDIYLGD